MSVAGILSVFYRVELENAAEDEKQDGDSSNPPSQSDSWRKTGNDKQNEA